MIEKSFHPVADIFPLLAETELSALAQDIATNGLREPIWLYDDRIIDGRNRYRACLSAGVDPVFRPWLGDEAELVPFVVSLNLHRRHLNESQRAMVAAKIANLAEGRPRDKSDAPLLGETAQICAVSQEAAADLLNVSRRSVQAARAVKSEGAPELVEAVEQGRVSVSAAADVARIPQAEQVEIVAKGEREILEAAKRIRAERAEVRREERLDRIAEISKGNAELKTEARYPVIYADPPWRYELPAMGGTNRSIENHYPTMTLEEICALPVSDLATDDAILYLWATAPKLAECFKVIEAWGFQYRTNIVWDKEKIGMGYHARNQHELLLICKRGEIPPPAPGTQPSSVYREARGEHSAKPAFYYEMIEGAYPQLPKIELFCRSPRDGWAVWGNQSGVAA